MNVRVKIVLLLGALAFANTGCVTLATRKPNQAAQGKQCAPTWAPAYDLGISVAGIVGGIAVWGTAPPSGEFISLPSGPQTLWGGLIVLAGVSYFIGSGITVALVDVCGARGGSSDHRQSHGIRTQDGEWANSCEQEWARVGSRVE